MSADDSRFNQKRHEGTTTRRFKMLRVTTRLPDDLEAIVTTTIGCCLRVHRALGPGLLESICARAVCIELEASGLPFEREQEISLKYRGQAVGVQRLDLVVAGRLLLELKSVDRLVPVHHAQVISYLRASGIRVALLVNFNVPIL